MGPMKHRHSGIFIGVKRQKSGMQLTRRGAVHSIAYIGAVQRHHADWAMLADFNRVFHTPHDASVKTLSAFLKIAAITDAPTGDQVQLLQLVISGIAQGCIYGLIALGFVLIYKATETVSFAQGELMMLGAFGGLAGMSLLGFPYWLSVLGSIAAMALFGMVLERVVIRPILGQPAFSIVMLTIGIGYVARGLITMIPNIGTETHTLPVPYKDQIWNVGALVLNVEQMAVIGTTGLL